MPEPAGYAPLGAVVERQRRRALFLQSYKFSVERQRRQGPAEWLGLQDGRRLARRLRDACGAVARAAGRARGAARWWVGAGLTWAWRGWRPRAADPLLGCFGGSSAAHHKYYLHDSYASSHR